MTNSDSVPTPDPITEAHDQSSVQPLDSAAEGEPRGSTPDEIEQSELDLGVISTGAPVVDQALAPLERLSDVPVSQHTEVFERVLSDLSATMAEGVADESSPNDA